MYLRGALTYSVLLAGMFFCQAERQKHQEMRSHPYINFDDKGNYRGFTQKAHEIMSLSHTILRKRKEIFTAQFKQFESIYHAMLVNRLVKGNMLLYGPPGGAKSASLDWLLSHEKDPAFKLQLHQMMTEQVFVGAQSFVAAQEGRFEINTAGSLADFSLAFIDELDKGNPATLAALLSLMNEREVRAGSKIVHSSLETIFSTSNARLSEFYQQFTDNGMRSTASALLDRFTTVAFVPNWLAESDQAALDHRYETIMGHVFKEYDKTIGAASEKLILDWEALGQLAHCVLMPTNEFFDAARTMFNMLRKSPKNASLSTVQYTERLRQRLHDVIIMSVFLDLLSSKLVQGDLSLLERILKGLSHHRLPIGPRSLWRAYLALTTVTFGEVALVFPTPEGGHAVELTFGNFFAPPVAVAFSRADNSSRADSDDNYGATVEVNEILEEVNDEDTSLVLEQQRQFKEVYSKVVMSKEQEYEPVIVEVCDCSCDTVDIHHLKELTDSEQLLYTMRVA
jgi:hypothetical protein